MTTKAGLIIKIDNYDKKIEEIVKAGYANVMTIPPNVKYKDKFLKAYKEARKGKRGLWNVK